MIYDLLFIYCFISYPIDVEWLLFVSKSGAKVVKITQKAQEIEQKMIEMLREWKKVPTFAAR